jgi:hypothetical protein
MEKLSAPFRRPFSKGVGGISSPYFSGVPKNAGTSEIFLPTAIGNVFGRIIPLVAMGDFKEVIGSGGSFVKGLS